MSGENEPALNTDKDTLVICSGGLDSVTLAYDVRNRLAGLLSFDYGQRHVTELYYAGEAAKELKVPHHIVDLTSLTALLAGSSLTDRSVDVPKGHYAQETMKATVVPNRNAIMLSIAFGVAASKNLKRVGAAVHSGDHHIYADCRPAFAAAFQEMEDYSLAGDHEIELYLPYLHMDKTHIAARADAVRCPVEKTWTCYVGGSVHCGECGSCVERRESFLLADVPDPTKYAVPFEKTAEYFEE